MRGYVAVTGTIFAAIAAVHGARLVAEGMGPLRDPIFVVTTALAVAVAAWSLATLLRRR